MLGAHQNLNGSRDLTTPLSGMICHPWQWWHLLRSTYVIKFEVSVSTQYENMKGYVKYRKWDGLGHSWSLEIVPFDIAHAAYDFLLAYRSNYVPVLHRF